MTNQELWQEFWESVNYGEQGDVEGIIWQKASGQWAMLVGDPQTPGRVMSIGGLRYNPWSGEELPTVVALQPAPKPEGGE